MGTKQYMLLKAVAAKLGYDTSQAFRVTNTNGFMIELCPVVLTDVDPIFQGFEICGKYKDQNGEHEYLGVRMQVENVNATGDIIPLCDNLFHHAVHVGVTIFAQRVGVDVRLILPGDNYLVTVQPKKGGCITVVASGMPPGDYEFIWTDRMYEVDLTKNEDKKIRMANGSKGYGHIVTNRYDERVGQIVGHTLYLFLPFEGRTSSLEPRSGDLLQKFLRDVWNGYQILVSDTDRFDDAPPLTSTALVEEFERWDNMLPQLLGEKIKEIDNTIQEATEELNKLLNFRAEQQRVMDGIVASNRKRKKGRRFASQVRMIHRNKNIRSCSYVQGAIQVETSTFQMEHEGAFYRLGAYTVRIHPDGSIHVFQLEPQHPKGQIHPHVNQFGIPCLGNITREVMERCISQDIAGAINLLVNFLLEGYDPGVAQAKITEWPRVEVTV